MINSRQLIAASAVTLALLVAAPALAKDRCRDWGQPSFKCPTTATRAVCGKEPNLYCFDDRGNPNADLCSGVTPAPRFKFDCETCTCRCDEEKYPCDGCSSAKNALGATCNGVVGGAYVDRCGTCGCGAGTAICVSTNTCVTIVDCPTGFGFEPCSAACIPGFVTPTATVEPPVPPSGETSTAPSSAADQIAAAPAAPADGRPEELPAGEMGERQAETADGSAFGWTLVLLAAFVAGLGLGSYFSGRFGRPGRVETPFHGVVEKISGRELSLTVGQGRDRRRLSVSVGPAAEINALTLPEEGEGRLERHHIPLACLRPHDTVEVAMTQTKPDKKLIADSVALMTTDATLARRRACLKEDA
ncbi:MAG: hypothetical protein PHT12_02675 [Patescibacteria group bacterium]|nr:hypothetical protein [Patescibacteria group bacterium]